jgi:hypothetical protein
MGHGYPILGLLYFNEFDNAAGTSASRNYLCDLSVLASLHSERILVLGLAKTPSPQRASLSGLALPERIPALERLTSKEGCMPVTSKRRSPFAALLACALWVPSACQHTKTAASPIKLAVKFPPSEDGSPEYFLTVHEKGRTSTEMSAGSLRPLLGGGAHASPEAGLKLDFTVAKGKVTTTVYSIPPESDPLRYSHTHRLGVHSARLNETVELNELARIGYQPFTLQIVGAKPVGLTHPIIVSKVPSIQVDLADQDVSGYTLSCHCATSLRVTCWITLLT